MPHSVQFLDVVALTKDFPEHKLQRGQVGTVVEVLAPAVFEVEFADNEGRAYALTAIKAHHLLPLRYDPAPVVS